MEGREGRGRPLSLRHEALFTASSAATAVRSPKWHLSTPRIVASSQGSAHTPRTPGGSASHSAAAGTAGVGSPREWIRGIERLRNSDTVASLLRPPELSRRDVDSIHEGSKAEMAELMER